MISAGADGNVTLSGLFACKCPRGVRVLASPCTHQGSIVEFVPAGWSGSWQIRREVSCAVSVLSICLTTPAVVVGVEVEGLVRLNHERFSRLLTLRLLYRGDDASEQGHDVSRHPSRLGRSALTYLTHRHRPLALTPNPLPRPLSLGSLTRLPTSTRPPSFTHTPTLSCPSTRRTPVSLNTRTSTPVQNRFQQIRGWGRASQYLRTAFWISGLRSWNVDAGRVITPIP
ncbi:hypothetical protein DFS34DRAFT_101276 [Phlyctochytrium arcticum]|nr:hypothetical protein DFS34DRAFT_101276 [Phlyctochytrium arcticum]